MSAQPEVTASHFPDDLMGSAYSTYKPHRVARRDHCGVCISILHHQGGSFAPGRGAYERKSTDGYLPLEKQAYLCNEHRLAWQELDNPFRTKAGKKPW